jgi:hypothetical protein
MPDINGRDLAGRVGAIRRYVKVFFMSGYTDAEIGRVKALDRTSGFRS